ncbi:hypothetical protein QBC44DRAFT_330276 [Cladorrhinum sp. PSN332]|nr:hypothetical protein QBC44DRAFT_330276 [Cladorrhinum sp. PSN332]
MDSATTPFLPRRPPNADSLSSGDSHSTYEDDDGNNNIGNAEKHLISTKELEPRRTFFSRLIIYLFAIWGLFSLLNQTYNLLVFDPNNHNTTTTAFSSSPTPDVYRPSTLPPSLSPLCYCGTNPTEARLLYNCTYDTLSTAWLPPHCRDEDLTAEFDRSGPGPNNSWAYFADSEGKIPLTIEQVASLGGTGQKFWAYRRWHVVHCLFYWQKYWRMRRTGKTMEERFDSFDHVKHCIRLILNPEPDHLFLIEVPVRMNSSEDAVGAVGAEGHENLNHHHGSVGKGPRP